MNFLLTPWKKSFADKVLFLSIWKVEYFIILGVHLADVTPFFISRHVHIVGEVRRVGLNVVEVF